MADPNKPDPAKPADREPDDDGSSTYGVRPAEGRDKADLVREAAVILADAAKTSGRENGTWSPLGNDRTAGEQDRKDPLLKAIEKLTKAIEDGGRKAEQGPRQAQGGDNWAKGVLTRFGENAAGAVHRHVGKWFGKEAGDAAGQGTRNLANKAVGKLFKGGGQAPPAAGGRAASGGAGKAAAGAGEAEGAGAAEAAGGAEAAAAGPAAVIVVAAMAVKAFADAVVEGTMKQHEVNMKYGEFSAAMSAVQLQDQMQQYQRNREIGDATAASAGVLQGSKSRYEDEAAEFEKLGNNLKNVALTVGMEMLTKVLAPFAALATRANEWLDKNMGGGHASQADMNAWMKQAEADMGVHRKRGDEWFDRPPKK